MTAPLPPGLERAIAEHQALRARLEARRAAHGTPVAESRPDPARRAAGPLPRRPDPWPQPGQGRFARPVPIRDAVNVWVMS